MYVIWQYSIMMTSTDYIPKNYHYFFMALPVLCSERNDDIQQLLYEDNSED